MIAPFLKWKILKVICFLLFAITMVFIVSQAQGAEWVNIGSDKDGTEYFYDSETMTKLPTDIVKVWMKFQYSDEGRRKYIQQWSSQEFDGNRYDTLSYSLTLEEVNCKTRTARTMKFTNYSADRAVLQSISPKQETWEGWESIVPESMGEKMYKVVCPPQKKE